MSDFVVPSLLESADGRFGVALDGKALKTPAGTEIAVAPRALALGMVAEWLACRVPRGKAPKIDFGKLPLTRIVGTALDRIPLKREAILDELIAYAETELLCFRASVPAALVERQVLIWQPLLDWLALAYDAPLIVSHTFAAPDQPPPSLAALRKALAAMDDLKLAGIGVAVAVTGSLVTSLALADGRIDASGAFDAAELDASFQIERWGEDSESALRRAGVRAELIVAERFFGLARG